jgi:hypothetical protein
MVDWEAQLGRLLGFGSVEIRPVLPGKTTEVLFNLENNHAAGETR